MPQPSFLGQSASREVKDHLETKISVLRYDRRTSEAVPEYQAFEQKIEAAVKLCKRRSKSASKTKKMQARLQAEHRWVRCLERIQAYLGLRLPSQDEDQAQDQSQGQVSEENQENPGIEIKPDEPAPHPMANEPIFVSIDIECNERCHSQVTEVGISILDTHDIEGIPPGQDAVNWTQHIQPLHLRVREYTHVVNHNFVAGCPDRFEFGESQLVSREELPSLIQDYIMRISSSSSDDGSTRNIVFVGHNPSADIGFLQELEVPVFTELKDKPVFLEIVDTAEIFRVSRQEMTVRSLGTILAGLGVTGWYLHNAGNDARYTLQAMTMLAVSSYRVRSYSGVTTEIA